MYIREKIPKLLNNFFMGTVYKNILFYRLVHSSVVKDNNFSSSVGCVPDSYSEVGWVRFPSSPEAYYSAPRSVLRVFIAHGILTRAISSNIIRRPLHLSAYQDGPSLRHADDGHCILGVLWHFCFAFSPGILFLFSVLIICYSILFCVYVL